MRRRVGVGGIQKKRLEDKKFVAKGDELAENQVDGGSHIHSDNAMFLYEYKYFEPIFVIV